MRLIGLMRPPSVAFRPPSRQLAPRKVRAPSDSKKQLRRVDLCNSHRSVHLERPSRTQKAGLGFERSQ